MSPIARILIVAGVLLIVAGLAFAFVGRLGVGRLPGDIVFRRGNFTFYFPLMTSLLLSILLTLAFWIFRR